MLFPTELEPEGRGGFRHDPVRIDPAVRFVVVPSDMFVVTRLSYTRNLVKPLEISAKIRILGDHLPRTLEVGSVDRIETYQCREEADISFSETVSDQEICLAEMFFPAV